MQRGSNSYTRAEASILTRPTDTEINLLLAVGSVEVVRTVTDRFAKVVLTLSAICAGQSRARVLGNLTDRSKKARTACAIEEVEGVITEAAIQARIAVTGIDLDLTTFGCPTWQACTAVVIYFWRTNTIVFAWTGRAAIQKNTTVPSRIT